MAASTGFSLRGTCVWQHVKQSCSHEASLLLCGRQRVLLN